MASSGQTKNSRRYSSIHNPAIIFFFLIFSSPLQFYAACSYYICLLLLKCSSEYFTQLILISGLGLNIVSPGAIPESSRLGQISGHTHPQPFVMALCNIHLYLITCLMPDQPTSLQAPGRERTHSGLSLLYPYFKLKFQNPLRVQIIHLRQLIIAE